VPEGNLRGANGRMIQDLFGSLGTAEATAAEKCKENEDAETHGHPSLVHVKNRFADRILDFPIVIEPRNAGCVTFSETIHAWQDL
jgi:hypothetical protein